MTMLKLLSAICILGCTVALASVGLVASAEPHGPAPMRLPCPHNTCLYCSEVCPDPRSWGICFPDPGGGYCQCEIVDHHVDFCWPCISYQNPYGMVQIFDDRWYDWIGEQCSWEPPCLEFSMKLCDTGW
jgi:hypothetical protein